MSKVATMNHVGSAALTAKAYTDARLDALTLADLADARQAASAADGSILIRQNGQWVPSTVEGAIGGKPVFVDGGKVASAAVTNNSAKGLQLQGVFNDGSQYVVAFIDGDRINLYRAAKGSQEWESTDVYLPERDTGWRVLETDYYAAGKPKYRKKNGIVFVDINGTLARDIPAGGAVIGTLPEGFRPGGYATFAVGSHTVPGTCMLATGYGYISPSGGIRIGFSEAFLTTNGYPDGSVCYPAA